MKTLNLNQMEMIEGGKRSAASWVMCGLAVGGFGVAAAALFSTGVGAPVALSAAGYILATPSLAGCFM